MLEITLFSPVPLNDGSTTILYKSIKDFHNNGDGSVSFVAILDGVDVPVSTSLHWRTKQTTATAAPAPTGGNRSRNRGY